MSGYRQVDDEFWADTIGWPTDERDLAIYLLTCEYRNTEGLFRIRLEQIVADRRWDRERIVEALAGLRGRGWALHEDGWMLLRKSLRWTPPNGPKQMAGAERKVKTVPRDSAIWAEFHAAAVEFCPEFAGRLDTPSVNTDTPSGTSTPDPLSVARDTQSPVRDTGSFSTSTSSSNSSSSSNSTSEPVAAVTSEIRDALTNAGFDRLVIEQSHAAIGQVLREFKPPADVDWYATGQKIRRDRESGEMRADRPSSAIKWVAKGLGGYPRKGQGPRGATVSPIDHYAAMRRGDGSAA